MVADHRCCLFSRGIAALGGERTCQNCQVQSWCVCQWAFASYVENAGGCEHIQDIKCNAINMQAVTAYQRNAGNKKYRDALECLESRCGVEKNE